MKWIFCSFKIYLFLIQDPKKSTKIWKDLYKNKKKKDWSSRDLEIFGNLAIYLRKWVSECFAGIYGGQTLLFLWDFCFMHGWSKKIFYKIGLVSNLCNIFLYSRVRNKHNPMFINFWNFVQGLRLIMELKDLDFTT